VPVAAAVGAGVGDCATMPAQAVSSIAAIISAKTIRADNCFIAFPSEVLLAGQSVGDCKADYSFATKFTSSDVKRFVNYKRKSPDLEKTCCEYTNMDDKVSRAYDGTVRLSNLFNETQFSIMFGKQIDYIWVH
jgi:hypothetical protein